MAHEELEQVGVMDGAGVVRRKLWSSLYYAMCYAAKAALLAFGYEPRSHRGANVLVGTVRFHERGLIERPSAGFFSEMRRLREEQEFRPNSSQRRFRSTKDGGEQQCRFVRRAPTTPYRRG